MEDTAHVDHNIRISLLELKSQQQCQPVWAGWAIKLFAGFEEIETLPRQVALFGALWCDSPAYKGSSFWMLYVQRPAACFEDVDTDQNILGWSR